MICSMVTRATARTRDGDLREKGGVPDRLDTIPRLALRGCGQRRTAGGLTMTCDMLDGCCGTPATLVLHTPRDILVIRLSHGTSHTVRELYACAEHAAELRDAQRQYGGAIPPVREAAS
jgi:hypothetical protein